MGRHTHNSIFSNTFNTWCVILSLSGTQVANWYVSHQTFQRLLKACSFFSMGQTSKYRVWLKIWLTSSHVVVNKIATKTLHMFHWQI